MKHYLEPLLIIIAHVIWSVRRRHYHIMMKMGKTSYGYGRVSYTHACRSNRRLFTFARSAEIENRLKLYIHTYILHNTEKFGYIGAEERN